MLLNELPEREDEITEETQETPETSSPSTSPTSETDTTSESSVETNSPEEAEPTPAVTEETPSQETPDAEVESTPSPETSDSENESDEQSDVDPESEMVSESDDDSQDGDTEEEVPAPEAPVDHEAIITRIDALISASEPGAQILTDVSIPDLTQLVNWMAYDSNMNQHVGRVGLIRHAFDALKAANSLSHDMESDFRAAFATYNKQRSKQQQSNSGAKEQNASKKRELITKLRDIVNYKNPEMVGEVRSLQDEWKTIGQVPARDLEPLYKEYRGLLDEFYELRSVHLELMEYDRKKNLEERERLIEIAKALIPAETDRENPEIWKEKLDMLQELQQEWKTAGHVPREDMERINEAYRDAIDAFFEVRQGFKAIEDKMREENATKKNHLLVQLEEFRDYQGDSPKTWNETSQKVRAIQEVWKEIGPGPSKVNGELWGKYRDVCNAFYNNKSAFFKGLDEKRSANLELKKGLIEKAEALSSRTDWEPAAKELKSLQTEWRTIGPVPDRHSQKLWNKFRSACDVFFEARRQHYAELHAVEKENLVYRKSLIEEVKALAESEKNPGEIVNSIKEIQARWKESGRVPYKEKEKIWKEFRKEIDKIFSGLDNKRGESRRERTVTRIENIDNDDERTRAIKGNIARIRKKIAVSQEKVDQYSTNIQFIARGKSGDALRNQIQGEIDKEEKFIKGLKKEIKDLNELLKNPPKEEKPAEAPAETEAAPAAEATPEAPAQETADAAPEAKAEEAPTEPAVAEAPVEEKKEEASEAPAEEEKKEE